MEGTTLDKFEIAAWTRLRRKEKPSRYRAALGGYNGNVIIKNTTGIQAYLDRALESKSAVYVPCLIQGKLSSKLHIATPLNPPGVFNEPVIIAEKLIIPDLKVDSVNNKHSSSRGYVLTSEYLGSKKFYCSPNETVELGLEDQTLRFIGVVKSTTFTGDLPMAVRVICSSREFPDVFSRNNTCIADILLSDAKFWWDFTALPSPRHY